MNEKNCSQMVSVIAFIPMLEDDCALFFDFYHSCVIVFTFLHNGPTPEGCW